MEIHRSPCQLERPQPECGGEAINRIADCIVTHIAWQSGHSTKSIYLHTVASCT